MLARRPGGTANVSAGDSMIAGPVTLWPAFTSSCS